MTPPFVRIILVDYKSGIHLQRTIDGLAAQTDGDFEAVIVDNACPEGAARMLDLPDERFRVLTTSENLGFAGGSNFGAAGAKSRFIATLNPDATPAADWLTNIKKAAERNCETALFGATLLTNDDPALIDGFGDVLSIYGIPWRGGHGRPVDDLPDDDREVFSPCGAAAFYRRDVFEALGGFDEDFFCYIEDIDFALRARLAGERCIQVRQAICTHVGAVSTEDNPLFRVRMSARNSALMILKTAPSLYLIPLFGAYLIVSAYFAMRHAGDHARARLGGLREALKDAGRALEKREMVSRVAARETAQWLQYAPTKLQKQPIVSLPTGSAATHSNEHGN
ncbi:MAG: hypothetical protein DHS20C05_12580 [Hyphococcus sp.]|nr:MAG: hypothetical protein DHS20C05_12580 [Marinicaulis sp.]